MPALFGLIHAQEVALINCEVAHNCASNIDKSYMYR